jgi:hypothetical protein
MVARSFGEDEGLDTIHRGGGGMNEDLKELLHKLFLAGVVGVLIYVVYQAKITPQVYADPTGLTNLPKIADAAPVTPRQTSSGIGRAFDVGAFQVLTLAEYDIHGVMVKKAHTYYDGLSSVSWLDMGIAFGKFLQKPALIDQVNFFENERFLWVKPKKGFEEQFQNYTTEFSNNHLIFSTKKLQAEAERVKEGHKIRLRGYLVALESDHMRATSSLVRDDEGSGACEIIFVTDVKTYD